jgi:hypothetical protein
MATRRKSKSPKKRKRSTSRRRAIFASLKDSKSMETALKKGGPRERLRNLATSLPNKGTVTTVTTFQYLKLGSQWQNKKSEFVSIAREALSMHEAEQRKRFYNSIQLKKGTTVKFEWISPLSDVGIHMSLNDKKLKEGTTVTFQIENNDPMAPTKKYDSATKYDLTPTNATIKVSSFSGNYSENHDVYTLLWALWDVKTTPFARCDDGCHISLAVFVAAVPTNK